MASTAAPIFFPSFEKHIDGAIMSNNPALIAVTTAMSEETETSYPASHIHVLSLGTGRTIQYIDGDKHDWGIVTSIDC